MIGANQNATLTTFGNFNQDKDEDRTDEEGERLALINITVCDQSVSKALFCVY